MWIVNLVWTDEVLDFLFVDSVGKIEKWQFFEKDLIFEVRLKLVLVSVNFIAINKASTKYLENVFDFIFGFEQYEILKNLILWEGICSILIHSPMIKRYSICFAFISRLVLNKYFLIIGRDKKSYGKLEGGFISP